MSDKQYKPSDKPSASDEYITVLGGVNSSGAVEAISISSGSIAVQVNVSTLATQVTLAATKTSVDAVKTSVDAVKGDTALMVSDIDAMRVFLDSFYNEGVLTYSLGVRNDQGANVHAAGDGDQGSIAMDQAGRVGVTSLLRKGQDVNTDTGPVIMGFRGRNTQDTPVDEDQCVYAAADQLGRQVILPYGLPNDIVSFLFDPTSNSPEEAIISPGAGFSLQILSLGAQNYNVAAEQFVLTDGATTLIPFSVAALSNSPHMTFPGGFLVGDDKPLYIDTTINHDIKLYGTYSIAKVA